MCISSHMNMFKLYVIKHDLINTHHSNLDCCIVYAHHLTSMFTYYNHFFYFFICSKQLLLSFPCMPLRVYHQRKTVAISENDATRYHKSNSINLIIGQQKSHFDLSRWMIRHTFAQYANVKQCSTLIQFTVYVTKENCTKLHCFISWLINTG